MSVRRWILELLGDDHFLRIRRKVEFGLNGVYTQYPFQAGHGLPRMSLKVRDGAIGADKRRLADDEQEPESFDEWIRFLGMVSLNILWCPTIKLWGVSALKLHHGGAVFAQAKLDDIVAGAVGCNALVWGTTQSFSIQERRHSNQPRRSQRLLGWNEFI